MSDTALRDQPARHPASVSNPHFTHIHRRHDPTLGAMLATLLPGDYYVAEPGEWIGTVLGSCVSACVRDVRLGIGGMNHFMLPTDSLDGGTWIGSPSASAATRFGNVAMERLINEILKRGGQREQLEFKLVGGGKVLDALTDIGARNIQFVREYTQTEGFRVVGEDLGDVYPRKVLFEPATGSARVKKLTRAARTAVVADEARYMQRIDHTPIAGDIELF
jgi:chemotaxis protein CheD